VAALVYQRRRHVINLFTWPYGGAANQEQLTRNGYRAVPWNNAGMTYWAVSDLSAAELMQFVNLYRR